MSLTDNKRKLSAGDDRDPPAAKRRSVSGGSGDRSRPRSPQGAPTKPATTSVPPSTAAPSTAPPSTAPPSASGSPHAPNRTAPPSASGSPHAPNRQRSPVGTGPVLASPLRTTALVPRGESDSSPPALKLCQTIGTGEVVHILSLSAKDTPSIEPFERAVQSIARDLYQMAAGVTDIRVCHPQCGKVVFVVTFLSIDELKKFQLGPEKRIKRCLEEDLNTFLPGGLRSPRGRAQSGSAASPRGMSPRTSASPRGVGRGQASGASSLECSEVGPKASGKMQFLPLPTAAVDFQISGMLMPQTHTLASLLRYLKEQVRRSYDRKELLFSSWWTMV